MRNEPDTKRAVAFIDGQNLYYAAKHAFGYVYPNCDPLALAKTVSRANKWDLQTTCFYTGIPSAQDDEFWNKFWVSKLAVMGTRGIKSYTRPLKYRNQTVRLPGNRTTTILVGQEKGIDVRIALDVVRMALDNAFDVGIIFSQDQDLSEVASEVRRISAIEDRWIKLACAFPVSPTTLNRRGINGTDWIPIDRAMYDACLDPKDYRPGKKG